MRSILMITLGIICFVFTACTSDSAEPNPKDWSEEREAPEPKGPDPSPSASPTNQDDSDEDRRDTYKDIDLGNGDDIPEGSCGAYDAPTTPQEFLAVERCNPDHEYGVCPLGHKDPDVDKVIVGSSGDDVLEGTPGTDLICGMGGNDILIGNGGEDNIWGGPGNDYIEGGRHADFLEGGDGDDIIIGNNACLPAEGPKCGPDFLDGDGGDKDSGDDVLLGGTVSFGEEMDGGPGNDLLAPTPLRTAKNYVIAGTGNDVAVTLNFMPGRPDHVWLDDLGSGVDMTIPFNSACSADVEINFEKRDKASVTCSLPWGKKLEVLDTLLPVTATMDQDGEISMDMTLYNQLGNLSVSTYRDMLKVQGEMGEDVCVCDLYTKTPPDPRIPYDYPSD